MNMKRNVCSSSSNAHYRCFSLEGDDNVLAHSDSDDTANPDSNEFAGYCLSFHDDLRIKAKYAKNVTDRRIGRFLGKYHVPSREGFAGVTRPSSVSILPNSYVLKMLSISQPGKSGTATAIRDMIETLVIPDEPDILGFFENLVTVAARATEEIAENGVARMLVSLRQSFLAELSGLALSRFARLMKNTFSPRFTRFKEISRNEHGAGKTRFFSLEIGAWDAFGAAVVEDARRRGIRLPRPDTRYHGEPLGKAQQDSLEACWEMVSATSRERLVSLAASALRIIISLPAGDPLSCGKVLGDLRKSIHIDGAASGDARFAAAFESVFSTLAMASVRTDPAAAAAMRCLCTWLEKDPNSTEVLLFLQTTGCPVAGDGPAMVHDIKLMAKCLARGLSQTDKTRNGNDT